MDLQYEIGFLLKKLRSKHRSWLRKKQRELEFTFPGKVNWHWMREIDDVSGLCSLIESVAARTYQRGLGAGFVNDEEHRQRFTLFASRGQLRAQLLEIDGQVRAYWIGIVYQGVFHSWETGYDPDLHVFEPGTLIFLRMVDQLVLEGVRKLDFGLGDAAYKRRFGDHSWREATVRLFAPSAKGVAIRSVLGTTSMLDGVARRFLQKIGVLDRLKTGWRRRLAPADLESTRNN